MKTLTSLRNLHAHSNILRKTYTDDENIEEFEKTYVLTLPSPAIFFMGHLETVH